MTRRLMQGAAIFLWATLLSLSFGPMPIPVQAGTPAVDVTVEQARELAQQRGGQKDFVILDVRTPEEFRDGHLSGAVNLNLLAPDFTAKLGALDRGKTYLVYCRSGNRSTKAVRAMEGMDFRSIYHMRDGILGWQAKGFPLSRS